MEHKYDIFISYRRKDSGDKAEHLKDLLESDFKNRISFDRENLTGLFDVALAERIDNCNDFLLVIGKSSLKYNDEDFSNDKVELYNYLGKCSLQEFKHKIEELGPNAPIDFVRIEIARALNRKGLNIIPIAPENSSDFTFASLNLPPDIVNIIRYNAIFYSSSPNALFKDIIPKIKKRLISNTCLDQTPDTKPNHNPIWKIILQLFIILLIVMGVYFIKSRPIEQEKEVATLISNDNPFLWLSERKYSEDEFRYKTSDPNEMRIWRNAIYARHGYIFTSPDLTKYFNQYSWYIPNNDNVKLTPIENHNVAVLRRLEKEK